MNLLFDAIREQHPGFEVMDIRLLADQNKVADQDADELDAKFAQAIKSAERKHL